MASNHHDTTTSVNRDQGLELNRGYAHDLRMRMLGAATLICATACGDNLDGDHAVETLTDTNPDPRIVEVELVAAEGTHESWQGSPPMCGGAAPAAMPSTFGTVNPVAFDTTTMRRRFVLREDVSIPAAPVFTINDEAFPACRHPGFPHQRSTSAVRASLAV